MSSLNGKRSIRSEQAHSRGYLMSGNESGPANEISGLAHGAGRRSISGLSLIRLVLLPYLDPGSGSFLIQAESFQRGCGSAGFWGSFDGPLARAGLRAARTTRTWTRLIAGPEMGRAVSGNDETVAGSFRAPAGFVFRRDGAILRHVARSYGPVYDRLVASGLYQSLVRDGLLLPHDEVPAGPQDKEAHRILAPVEVPFISYPYEWCFSQLRDSALVTLDIQIRAIEFRMSLKDASAYNIQLSGGRPALVDTLSFEEYEEGYPWV